jgi:hypothetical protein
MAVSQRPRLERLNCAERRSPDKIGELSEWFVPSPGCYGTRREAANAARRPEAKGTPELDPSYRHEYSDRSTVWAGTSTRADQAALRGGASEGKGEHPDEQATATRHRLSPVRRSKRQDHRAFGVPAGHLPALRRLRTHVDRTGVAHTAPRSVRSPTTLRVISPTGVPSRADQSNSTFVARSVLSVHRCSRSTLVPSQGRSSGFQSQNTTPRR